MKFTYDQLLGALEGAVEEMGEHYIYPPSIDGRQCRYTHGPAGDLSCGCLIGHALYRLGISPEELNGYDDDGEHVDVAAKYLPYWADWRASTLAAGVQCRQDAAVEWGRALSLALREMGVNH